MFYRCKNTNFHNHENGSFSAIHTNRFFQSFLSSTCQNSQNTVNFGSRLTGFPKNLSAFGINKSAQRKTCQLFSKSCSSQEKTNLTFGNLHLLFLKLRLNYIILVYIRKIMSCFSEVCANILKNRSIFCKFAPAFLEIMPKPESVYSLLKNHAILFKSLHQHFQKHVGFFKKYVSPSWKQVVLTKILTIFLLNKFKCIKTITKLQNIRPVFYNVGCTSFKANHGLLRLSLYSIKLCLNLKIICLLLVKAIGNL
jgi:hypothetical protein